MYRFKTTLFLLILGFSAFVSGCDTDDTNSPPSPRLFIQGAVSLEVEEDKTAFFSGLADEIRFDGASSFDLQGEEFSLEFTLTAPEGSAAQLVLGEAGETATLTPDVAGEYAVTLTATDLSGQTAEQSKTFTARENAAPVAALAADAAGTVGVETQLDATASADGDDGFELDDDLVFSWRIEMPEGASEDIANKFAAATAATVNFTPDVAGEYKVFVKASDRFDDSEEVSITLPVGAVAEEEDEEDAGGLDVGVILERWEEVRP